MNTDKEIKRIAQEITPFYCYGTPYYLNTQTDKMRARLQMPACLHIQTSEGSELTSASPYFQTEVRTRRVQVGFADAVKFDQDPELTLMLLNRLVDLFYRLSYKPHIISIQLGTNTIHKQAFFHLQIFYPLFLKQFLFVLT